MKIKSNQYDYWMEQNQINMIIGAEWKSELALADIQKSGSHPGSSFLTRFYGHSFHPMYHFLSIYQQLYQQCHHDQQHNCHHSHPGYRSGLEPLLHRLQQHHQENGGHAQWKLGG